MKVEPQLVRIGERLGRYNERKVKQAVEEAGSFTSPKSSFTKPVAPSISSPTSLDTKSTAEAETPANKKSFESEEAAPEVKVEQKKSRTSEETRELAAKIAAEDLQLWEDKFTTAAQEGAAEVEDRVDEISARMIERNANGMGRSLVKQLEETATTELQNLKRSIVSILE
ncbi:hypothetical protein PC116_g32407, partial [Phytophthora cactorum]